MMNGPRMPFRGGMPPQSFMPPMQARPPMGSMMRGAPQMRQGGGLLTKLMGGGQARGAAGTAGAASRAAGTGGSGAGGILKALSNPTAINGFLSNTQKVLNTAQQVGPMVQQYGPLVKNIPAMWKLYRGLKNGDDKEATADEKPKKETAAVPAKKTRKPERKEADLEISSPKLPKQGQKNGQSMPKLYV